MYPKHLNQTNRTMNVTIEHVFCRYSDEAEEIYFRIMNTILFATDETELRASMERLKNETTLDDYFIFGYGAVIGNEKYIIFGKMEYIRISNNDASFSVTMVHRFR